MLLVVPESYKRQVEILKRFGIGDTSCLDSIETVVVNKNSSPVSTKESKEALTSKKLDSRDEKAKIETKSEEPTAILKPVETVEEEDKIAMSNSKTCPVKIIPTKKNVVQRINVGKSVVEENVDESLEQFKAHLKEKSFNFTGLRRAHTGLVELNLTCTNNQLVPISVDIDDKLFHLGVYTFFIGKIKPLDEYNKPAVLFTDNAITAIINGQPIDSKYYVPKELVTLVSMIDGTSLHEHNLDKKKKALDKAFKAILEFQEEIKSMAPNQPYRFAFTEYKDPNNFSIISSNKNRVSNLSNDKLLTSKTLKIDVKAGKNLNITVID